MRLLPAILLLSVFFTGIAEAEEITLNPTDQNGINQALQNGGTIYLNAGIYEITGTINIHSNTVLTGSPDAIIRVSPSSSQWFTGQIGIISCSESLKNVEICGFSIDGNLGSLPASFANTPGHDKDCERCILLGGYSNDYAENISIHDIKLYDSFSDGIYLRYTTGAHCYNNIISNCQHEGIYLSVALQSEIYSNQIAGITSDCARLDNCVNCKVYNNVFFSYDGGNVNGAYKHGENGLQVGDAGVSHGYDARNKPTTTTNIEVFNNTFADNGLKAILLDNIALESSANVYIHDNKFLNATELKTSGISVELENGIMPTIEQSEQIFSSIFDALNKTITDSGITNQSTDSIQYTVQKTDNGLVAGGIKIIGFANEVNIDNETYIPGSNSAIVKYDVVQSPKLGFDIGIQNITNEVITKVENGNITATLNIVTKYYTVAYNQITKKSTLSIKISKLSFSDSIRAPKILNRPSNITGTAKEYQSNITHYTLISVSLEGLQKLVFEYNGSIATYYCMIGEKHTNANGIECTNYTRSNFWIDGDISHFGTSLYIHGDFDQNKLKVTAYTPYESFPVKIIKENHYWNEKSFSESILAFLAQLFVFVVIGWILIRIPFKR